MISPYAFVGMKQFFRRKGKITTGQQEEAAEKIIERICDYYGVDVERILASTRIQPIAQIRHICMFIVKEKTGMTVVSIGKYFNRDHTSILHAIKRVQDLIDTEREVRDDIQTFRMIV